MTREEDRNYRELIRDGLGIFISVNETLTRNFRRILTFRLSVSRSPNYHSTKTEGNETRLKRNTSLRSSTDIL